jgi:hypothetical protein
MIKINVVTNSKGGVPVPAGSVLNITPRIITRKELVDDEIVVKYDVGFDSETYKSHADWRADVNILPYIRAEMVEFPIGYYAIDVPFASLNPAALQSIYQDIIENGYADYPGVGEGNTEIINA